MKIKASLRNVLTVNFIIVALLPIMAIGLIAMQSLSSSLESQIMEKNFILASSLSNEMISLLQEPLTMLEQIKDVIEDDYISEENLNHYLSLWITNYRYFNMIRVLDEKGVVTHLAPFDKNISGLDMSTQSYFKEAREKNKTFWSRTFISPQTGLPTLSISIPFSGGVVVGHLELAFLQLIAEEIKIGSSGYIFIVDSIGIALSHPNRNYVSQRMNISSLPIIELGMSRGEGTVSYFDEGREMLGSVTIIPGTGWIIAVVQPLDEAYAPIRRVRNIILSGSLAATLLAIIIAFISLRNILSPLSKLTEESRLIAGGEYNYTHGEEAYLEIDNLNKSFQVMAKAIKSREEEVLKTRVYLKNIIDSTSSAIVTVSCELKVTHCNRAMAQLLELDERCVINSPLTSLSASFTLYSKDIERVLDERRAIYRHRVKLEELKGRLFDLSMFPLITEQVEGVVIHIDDITEKERVAEQLVQSQKMETVGTLAGGLAHDFNNILVGVVTTTSLMEAELLSEQLNQQSLKESITIIKRSGERAAAIVKQLLTLSRKSSISMRRVDLNNSITHVIQLCNNSFDKSIEIISRLPGEPVFIKADATQLEQLILNLCVNASHAMTIMREADKEPGGILTVKLKSITIDEEYCALHPDASCGLYYELQVEDTGVGIAPEELQKVFEPFYTKKKSKMGTGLGLSMVYSITKEHGGFITAYSELGRGTIFSVYLPAFESEEEDEKQTTGVLAERGGLYKGEGKILIIDDEEVVRKLAGVIAEKCGYKALTAASGGEGIEIFKREHSEIALIILDMSMPELSGKATYLRLKEIDPTLKVLIASGFTRDGRVEDMMKMGCKHFIQKPYTVENLSEVIKKAIEDSP